MKSNWLIWRLKAAGFGLEVACLSNVLAPKIINEARVREREIEKERERERGRESALYKCEAQLPHRSHWLLGTGEGGARTACSILTKEKERNRERERELHK